MRTYRIVITGVQPLLLHNDDIDWADHMSAWKDDKDNKKLSKAGDDRTPPFRWIGCLYRNDAGEVIVPTANLMRALMEGATMIPVPGGRSGKTFKSQSQSGIMPREIGWPLLINGGKKLATRPIDSLITESKFTNHRKAVEDMGFSLFVKRVKIGQAKHIRVRPRFENWSIEGDLAVIDDEITDEILNDILGAAGKYKGLCDWRPSSKTPGTFGMFTAETRRID